MEWLSHHPTIMNIARVAQAFGQDPVTLLRDGGDPFLTDVRIACLAVVSRDEEERARRSKSGRRQ